MPFSMPSQIGKCCGFFTAYQKNFGSSTSSTFFTFPFRDIQQDIALYTRKARRRSDGKSWSVCDLFLEGKRK